jgi:hypothetical protein
MKDLGRKGKACEATLVLDQSDAGSEALAKVQAQMLFRKSFPASAEVYAGISIKGQTLEDETKVVPGFEDWHYCVEFADGLGADIVTQPARGGEFLAIEQAVTEGRAWPDGKITKEEVRVIMKATELKKVVTQLNAAEAQLKTTKDGGIIKKLRATIKALEAKLQLHVRENKNEGEDKDSKDGLDMEAEGMEAIKALIPQHEDEEDEAYKARLAKAIKAVKASKAGEPCPEGGQHQRCQQRPSPRTARIQKMETGMATELLQPARPIFIYTARNQKNPASWRSCGRSRKTRNARKESSR